MQLQPGSPRELRLLQGLNKIALVLKNQQQSAAQDGGLSPTQAQILSLVHARGPMRVSNLAAELGITLATVSDAIGSLVTKKLAEKKADPADGRALALHLSPAGKKRAIALSTWPDFLLATVGVLDENEQQVFLRGLLKMIRQLQEERRIPVARMCVNCEYFDPGAYPNGNLPHHCHFVDAPFADADLRVDCQDFRQAPDGTAFDQWIQSDWIQIQTKTNGD